MSYAELHIDASRGGGNPALASFLDGRTQTRTLRLCSQLHGDVAFGWSIIYSRHNSLIENALRLHLPVPGTGDEAHVRPN
jgi:hypothetical protein